MAALRSNCGCGMRSSEACCVRSSISASRRHRPVARPLVAPGYDVAALEHVYTGDQARVALDRPGRSRNGGPARMRALGFCVSVAHARFMAHEFSAAAFRRSRFRPTHPLTSARPRYVICATARSTSCSASTCSTKAWTFRKSTPSSSSAPPRARWSSSSSSARTAADE